MGDLKSVVLHDLKITHIKSNFPVALGESSAGSPARPAQALARARAARP